MPHYGQSWDEEAQRGNPTRSDQVIKLLNRIKREEVRGEGVPPQGRRPLEWNEFIGLLVAIHFVFPRGNPLGLVLAAVITMQWQLCGRIDDVMKLGKEALLKDFQFPFCLNVHMTWSKMIREERDAPTQILFGAMDPLICPLLNLAVFLEHEYNASGRLFCNRSNKSLASLLNSIFNSPFFRKLRDGLLGTHSIRKGAATFLAKLSIARDVIQGRGRWKGKRKQVDTYIDINLAYPDAKAVGVLCGPRGPCKYVVKDDRAISDDTINALVPNIVIALGMDIA